ncbi:MAG: hypothetical protein ACOY3M_04280 [Patescibacteria group bacterium]
MTKYRAAVQQMLEENKELFDEFKPIHDAYVLNPAANQAKYNAIGASVMDVIREYERRLCAKMGAGQYSKFSMNLSEKFMEEIKNIYPKIMFIGVE